MVVLRSLECSRLTRKDLEQTGRPTEGGRDVMGTSAGRRAVSAIRHNFMSASERLVSASGHALNIAATRRLGTSPIRSAPRALEASGASHHSLALCWCSSSPPPLRRVAIRTLERPEWMRRGSPGLSSYRCRGVTIPTLVDQPHPPLRRVTTHTRCHEMTPTQRPARAVMIEPNDPPPVRQMAIFTALPQLPAMRIGVTARAPLRRLRPTRRVTASTLQQCMPPLEREPRLLMRNRHASRVGERPLPRLVTGAAISAQLGPVLRLVTHAARHRTRRRL